jgi:hypothetical protein
MAFFETSKLISWAPQFLHDLGFAQLEPTLVFEGDKSTIHMVENGTDRGKTKHMDVRFHCTRELVQNGTIRLEYQSTVLLVAYILTKAMPPEGFLRLRSILMGLIRAFGT